MVNEYISHSYEDTLKIASDFAASLKKGDVICMYGDLGVGKTVFVRGLGMGLGIEEPVTSPTFTIVNEYNGALPLYHFDVYRIGSSDEMLEIGFDEYICGDGVCVIEWPSLIEEILPRERYNIEIAKNYDRGDDFRHIRIEKTAAAGSEETKPAEVINYESSCT